MRDLKMDKVPDFIDYLEKEGYHEVAEKIRTEYEGAKEVQSDLKFYELVLICYLRSLPTERFRTYLHLAEYEAAMRIEIDAVVEEFKKHCVEGKKND